MKAGATMYFKGFFGILQAGATTYFKGFFGIFQARMSEALVESPCRIKRLITKRINREPQTSSAVQAFFHWSDK